MARDLGDSQGDRPSEVRVIWAPRAIANLTQIRDYIAEDSPDAAVRVAARILDAVELATTQPNMGRRGHVPGTRELVIVKTPYVAIYRVLHEALEVLAVRHGRRLWPDRIE